MILTPKQTAQLAVATQEKRQRLIDQYVNQMRKKSRGRQPRKVTPKEWSK